MVRLKVILFHALKFPAFRLKNSTLCFRLVYFLMVAKKDIVELDISVDQALKYVISMGVVPPHKKIKKT